MSLPRRRIASTPVIGRLPDGFTVELDPTTRRLDDGRLLIGGSPLTAMQLSTQARKLFTGRRVTVRDDASAHLADRLAATNLAQPLIDKEGGGSWAARLTVVIPVRDRSEQLDRCLAALHPLPVIVVDDASHDPAAVAEVARRHAATLVCLPVNVGPAGARNEGLARVTSEVVAFVDSDVEATTSALLQLARHLLDPQVSLVGPRVIGRVPHTNPRWFERYDAAASSLDLGGRPSSVRPGARVAWLPGACLVARADDLGTGFDDDLRVGEDVDLVWRMVGAGRRVRYDPSVTVRHDARPTIRGWLCRKVLYGSGGAVLAERHGGHVAPAVLSPTMALAGASLLLRSSSTLSISIVGAAVMHGVITVVRTLPADLPLLTRSGVAAGLVARGVGWSVRQESSLLLRHWWPAAALGCAFRPVRRAALTAVIVDTVVAAARHRDDDLGIATLVIGRRLDDLAYGAGLWVGAARARSVRVLRPRFPRHVPRP